MIFTLKESDIFFAVIDLLFESTLSCVFLRKSLTLFHFVFVLLCLEIDAVCELQMNLVQGVQNVQNLRLLMWFSHPSSLDLFSLYFSFCSEGESVMYSQVALK